MLIAKYTCNASGVVPSFNDGYVYEVNETENEGIYTVEITSEDDFSSCSFNGKSQLLTVEYLRVTSKVTNMSYMFSSCTLLTSLDVSNFDTSKVSNMYGMFNNCKNLTSLDVSNFDTSNVTSMNRMFSYCTNLTSLDVSNFDTSKVTNMTYMFYYCHSLTSLDVSNFDTSKVTNMESILQYCNNLNIGMLYCSQDTVNKLILTITDGSKTIWVKDTKASDYTATDYVAIKDYKEEVLTIQLSEPLRGLPNGVCDKFVKQGGKLYVERNCGSVVLDGNKGEWVLGNDYTSDTIITIACSVMNNSAWAFADKIICDRFVSKTGADSAWLGKSEGITSDTTRILISISKDKLPSLDDVGVRQWLSENPTTVVYQLETPAYEEIIDIELTTYLDTTHISTNSTIPCNMKIANSGYNAIIKPSTQYTVAFDTDKNGEVGINLGGAKVTTTNNVATITTPSTLTDDSLRLYGKGIKASNVRLLEGDKTNCVPSYFEGMKSCFEDKEQDNGSYEVEVLSNNKNLINLSDINLNSNVISEKVNNKLFIKKNRVRHFNSLTPIKLEPNTRYTFQCDIERSSATETYIQLHLGKRPHHDSIEYGAFTVLEGKNSYLKTFTTDKEGELYINGYTTTEGMYVYNIQIEKGDKTSYIEHKSNKIQLQLNEPLRAVGDVKDRFVFKDGKLMIERNCGEVTLIGEFVQSYSGTNVGSDTKPNVKLISLRIPNLKPYWGGTSIISDRLKSGRIGKGLDTSIEHIYWGTEENWISCNSHTENTVGITVDNNNLDTDDYFGAIKYIDNMNYKIVYELAEPTYEEVPFELQKLILVCYENGTLFIDTLIPPTVSVTYSANIPVISALNEQTVIQDQQDAMILENTVAIAMMNLME